MRYHLNSMLGGYREVTMKDTVYFFIKKCIVTKCSPVKNTPKFHLLRGVCSSKSEDKYHSIC